MMPRFKLAIEEEKGQERLIQNLKSFLDQKNSNKLIRILNHHKIRLEKNKATNKEIKEKKTKNHVKAIAKPDNKQKSEKKKSNRKIQ
uniref:Uncharacterized protein n=1 Tax=Meloidogyne incognita TaxID=6306 RepID=A0A914L4S6_MELIC